MTDEKKMRRELLVEILDSIPGNPIFGKLLDFYKNIFLQNPDLIVCMSRKSWCVIHLFLPFLEDEGIVVDRKKLTHDRMVHPWFAELDKDKLSQIKVFVIDDTFQTGRALDECIRRLKWAYNVNEKNLTVAVFAMTDDKYKYNQQRINGDLYTVYKSFDRGTPSFPVKWGGGDALNSKEHVSAFSYLFVEAIHACSVPYVGYIPAFCLPIKVVQDFFGIDQGKDTELNNAADIRIPGYLEQEDLREPFNDPEKAGYYNITSQQMRQHDIEAFYFSLPVLGSDSENMPFLPPKHALSIAALRFYLNSKTGIALIVPYLSLKDCRADKDIVQMFPKELQPLLTEMSKKEWKDNEEQLAAYRLLRYASGYLWGKHVFNEWFGLDVKDENIASNGGICSETFFSWLNGSSAVQDLTHIWSFFAPERNNVIEETQNLIPNGETSLEGIIHNDLLATGAEFSEAIIQSLSVSAPVDYYGTVSMMFRSILAKEQEIMNKRTNSNESKEEFSLAQPFPGFPIHTFFALFSKQFPKLNTRRNVPTTVTLMLCDMGVAVTQLIQRGKVIGTVLLNGEQSCHALAPIAPEYALFLSEFPGMLRECKKQQRKEKFEMAKTEIRSYFEYERSLGIGRRLSLDELMAPLDKLRPIVVDDSERDFIAYSVLPRSSFVDCSELFFQELREKLTS
jgi:hypothetical protein